MDLCAQQSFGSARAVAQSDQNHGQQDNAGVHTCKHAMGAVERNGYELIPHPAYWPDLAPSDFFLFPNLRGLFISGLMKKS